mmetsp:Transcript_11438/g.10100  ORF Transcript_11438/g.10100 Transcript_11438/m.10100 type:complete len:404 (+) Transcript_11438:38-1249(+)
MKILITLLSISIAITASSAANVCQVFQCGTIEQAGQPDNSTLCVHANFQQDTTHLVQSCEGNMTCPANGWTNPSQVANKTCSDEKEVVIADNIQRHGEVCLETKNCFNHAKGAFCDRNITVENFGACFSALKIGDACTRNGHNECPAQSYCNADRKCIGALTTGQVCDSKNFCQFGLICLASDEELKNHTCHAIGSLSNNATFLDDDVADIDEYFGINSACFEHTINNTDVAAKKICRGGDISKDNNRGDFMRNSPEDLCEFTTFIGNSTVGEEGKIVSEMAECGFNKNTNAWCRKRKGDQWFIKAFETLAATDFSAFNCHPLSSAKNCLQAHFIDENEVFANFDRALSEVDEDAGFARFALNDVCVAESVTAFYWRGNSPDGAFGFNLFALFALTLSAVSFM